MAVVVDFAMANVVVKGLTVGRTKYFPSQINKINNLFVIASQTNNFWKKRSL